jgi:hypothetical protein
MSTKPTPEQIREARAALRSAEDLEALEKLRKLSKTINNVRLQYKRYRKEPEYARNPFRETEFMWTLSALRGKVRSLQRDLSFEDRCFYAINNRARRLGTHIPLTEYDEILKMEEMPKGYDWLGAVLSTASHQMFLPAFGATPEERAECPWVYVWRNDFE